MTGYGPVSPDDVDYDEDGPDPVQQLDAQGEADNCPCGLVDDEWCPTLEDAGYPGCERCHQHHRHPETCAEDDAALAALDEGPRQ